MNLKQTKNSGKNFNLKKRKLLKKGPWTIEEDRKLRDWVERSGPKKWPRCAEYIEGRTGKQCRERWKNSLNPGIKKGNWSKKEDFFIFKLCSLYGSKWTKIALFFSGRTENAIKNRFYSTLRKISMRNSTEEKNCNCIEDLLQYFPIALREKQESFLKELTKEIVMERSPHESTLLTKVKDTGIDNMNVHMADNNEIFSPEISNNFSNEFISERMNNFINNNFSLIHTPEIGLSIFDDNNNSLFNSNEMCDISFNLQIESVRSAIKQLSESFIQNEKKEGTNKEI